jgi:hypothetical protein
VALRKVGRAPYVLRLCQGEQSQHVVVIGDGKSGKTSFVREQIVKPAIAARHTVWCYDYNWNGFSNCGMVARGLDRLLISNMQYLPQVKDRAECDAFCERALALGNRIVVLDEYHTQQNAKFISPLQARFLRTGRHHNVSWVVIAQSPLDFHEAVYSNADHFFCFYLSPANRHIKWYRDKIGKALTQQLIEAHAVARARNLPYPYVHFEKGGELKLYRAD